jgi:hypothetical protein
MDPGRRSVARRRSVTRILMLLARDMIGALSMEPGGLPDPGAKKSRLYQRGVMGPAAGAAIAEPPFPPAEQV